MNHDELQKKKHATNHDESFGWWFGTTEFYDFPIILGMSSSQVTPSFFGGVGLNHQPVIQDGNDLPTSMAPTGMFQLTKH